VITVFIAFSIFLMVIFLMAIGIIINKKAIQGSCGGLSHIGIEKECHCEDVCYEHKLYSISEPSKNSHH